MTTPSIALPGNNAKSTVIDILNARLAHAIERRNKFKLSDRHLKRPT